MNSFEMFRVLEAHRRGFPVPRGDTLRVDVAEPEDILLVAFVRMGGESVPWAAGIRRPGGPTERFWTPDPRKRTELARALRPFGKALAGFLRAPSRPLPPRHPQVWVPDPTHLDMLHLLALRYLWTRFEPPGEETPGEHVEDLRRLGRAANWIFHDSQHPGQTLCAAATEALRFAHAFPSDPTRQSHLGFLLAWLDPEGDGTSRARAAAGAEALSASVTLNPEVEREELVDAVDRHGRAGDPAVREHVGNRIGEVLAREIDRRLDLLEAALETLRRDPRPRNPGLTELRLGTMERLEEYRSTEEKAERGERVYLPGPETDDHPRKAAELFVKREKAGQIARSCLLFQDRELQDEAVAAGDAIRGTLIDIGCQALPRTRRILWTVRAPGTTPLRLRRNDDVACPALEGSKLRIESVSPAGDGREFVLRVTAPVTIRGGLDMASRDLEGREVILIPARADVPVEKVIGNIWKRDARGAWLVEALARPGGRRET